MTRETIYVWFGVSAHALQRDRIELRKQLLTLREAAQLPDLARLTKLAP